MEIDLNEAQDKLYELGEMAWNGQEIVITRKGKPYLLLVTHSEIDESEGHKGQKTEIIGQTESNRPGSC